MSVLEVAFEVPPRILQGLATGTFQRVGGVIVESGSKQVVAWLRDSGLVDTALNTVGNIPSPFSLILTAARVGVSLIDGAATRDAVYQVGAQVAEVGRQVQLVSTIASFTAAGQVVNLAMSAVTFYATMRRLDLLSEDINKLGEAIRAEFARDRHVDFKIALEAAREFLEIGEGNYHSASLNSATEGLSRARENFLLDFGGVMSSELSQERLLLAQHYLIRAMYAEVNRIRCYVAADKLEQAKKLLAETIKLFQTHTQYLTRAWLGHHPAILLHSSVSPENVERFLLVQSWLRDKNGLPDVDSSRVIFGVLNDLRADFWKPEIIEDRYDNMLGQLARRPVETLDTRLSRLIDNLAYAEVLIENFQRLQGFELELRSMRLSFQDWQAEVNEEDLAKHGLGIIYDEELLNRLSVSA